jgi:hypothetical protein
LDFFQARDSLPSTEITAFECGYGVSKPQSFYHLPIPEEAIDEPRMEDVTCTGRIDGMDWKPFDIEDFSIH